MNVNMEKLCWVSPVLFILHDMEEIVLGLAWKKTEPSRKHYLQLGVVPFGTADTTASLSACVFEELLILCLVSLFSACTNWYGLWFGMATANFIHLIALHLILIPLIYHAYVPGFVTALLTVLPCGWMLWQAQRILNLPISALLTWCVLGAIISIVNLKFLHKKAAKIGAIIKHMF